MRLDYFKDRVRLGHQRSFLAICEADLRRFIGDPSGFIDVLHF